MEAATVDDEAAAFAAFVEDIAPRLRRAFALLRGREQGQEASAEALAWAWEHLRRALSVGDRCAGRHATRHSGGPLPTDPGPHALSRRCHQPSPRSGIGSRGAGVRVGVELAGEHLRNRFAAWGPGHYHRHAPTAFQPGRWVRLSALCGPWASVLAWWRGSVGSGSRRWRLHAYLPGANRCRRSTSGVAGFGDGAMVHLVVGGRRRRRRVPDRGSCNTCASSGRGSPIRGGVRRLTKWQRQSRKFRDLGRGRTPSRGAVILTGGLDAAGAVSPVLSY